MTVTAFKDYPLAPRTRAWDGDAAERRVRKWAGAEDAPNAKYRDAHVWYDASAKDTFGAYKLLIADVIGGELKAVARVKSHLGKYYRRLGDAPPWERTD